MALPSPAPRPAPAILIRCIAARASSCELGLDMGRRFCVDQRLHKRCPIGKDEIGRDGSDVLEEARPRSFGGSGLGPELFEAVANRMECEGEQVHGGEHHGEVLLAVAEVVLKVVAVGLEDVEAFVLAIFHLALAQATISATVSRVTGSEVTNALLYVTWPLASVMVTPIQLTSIASSPSRSGAPSNQRKREVRRLPLVFCLTACSLSVAPCMKSYRALCDAGLAVRRKSLPAAVIASAIGWQANRSSPR